MLSRFATLGLVLALVASPVSAGLFNRKKKQQELSAQDSILLGIESMLDMTSDPAAMEELKKMLDDPKAMAEVEALMNDPAFQEEMRRVQDSPIMRMAMEGAADFMADPSKMAALDGAMAAEMRNVASQMDSGKLNAQMGFANLHRAAQDPNELMDALSALNDPAVAAEVQQMMADPAFMAEMKALTGTQEFKTAMHMAQQGMEELMRDPAALAQLEQQIASAMASV